MPTVLDRVWYAVYNIYAASCCAILYMLHIYSNKNASEGISHTVFIGIVAAATTNLSLVWVWLLIEGGFY